MEAEEQDRGGGSDEKQTGILFPGSAGMQFGFLARGKDLGDTGGRLDNRGEEVISYAC